MYSMDTMGKEYTHGGPFVLMKAALSAHSLKKILPLPVWLLNTRKSQLLVEQILICKYLMWLDRTRMHIGCWVVMLSCKVSVSLNWGACQMVELCLTPTPPTPFQSRSLHPKNSCYSSKLAIWQSLPFCTAICQEKGSRIWSSLYFHDFSHFLCVQLSATLWLHGHSEQL